MTILSNKQFIISLFNTVSSFIRCLLLYSTIFLLFPKVPPLLKHGYDGGGGGATTCVWLARRTVAKYRHLMKVPPAELRRQV